MATNTPRLPGENERVATATSKDARGVITELAIQSGAMTDAGELSEEMFRFGTMVAEHCARLADQNSSVGTGDVIRTAMSG